MAGARLVLRQRNPVCNQPAELGSALSLKGELCKLSCVRRVLSMLNSPAVPRLYNISGHARVQRDGSGVLPQNIWAFRLGWLWCCSSGIRCKANEPFSLQLARFVTCLHNCCYKKREKPYNAINLGLAKERGRAQFKLQLITEAARGSEESVCSYWDVGVCERRVLPDGAS